MSKSTYYKPRERREFTDDQKTKRKKLFFDKRVKFILNCSECDTPVTQAEFKRNGGVCDNCAR
jgi:hypothetical protein